MPKPKWQKMEGRTIGKRRVKRRTRRDQLMEEKHPRVTATIEDGRLVIMDTTHSLDQCAQVLLEWVGGLDPVWAERLQIMADERHLDTKQVLGSCVSYVLENALHMVIVKHDAFEPNEYRRGNKMACQQCGVEFIPPYPLAPFCGNSCAETHRKSQATSMSANIV